LHVLHRTSAHRLSRGGRAKRFGAGSEPRRGGRPRTEWPRDGAGNFCMLVRSNGTPKPRAGQVGEAAAETSYCPLPALRPSWPGGGPAGPGITGPSPCGCGDGVAPAPRLPVATPASRQRHRPSLSHGATLGCPTDPPQPVQLCRQWPGAVLQILQVAAAVERPAIEVAGPAPPIAGLRHARRGVVGLGPASAAAAFVEPDPGARVPSVAGLWVCLPKPLRAGRDG
jgi:hypothetical protein